MVDTPADYEPPHFCAAEKKEFHYNGDKFKIELGRLNCFWHAMKFELNVSEKMMIQTDDYDIVSTEKTKKKIDNIEPLNQSDLSNKYDMKELKEALSEDDDDNKLSDENESVSDKSEIVEEKDDGYDEDDVFDKKKLLKKKNGNFYRKTKIKLY
jgi:hypothetical protein